jgi:hypothetical protein
MGFVMQSTVYFYIVATEKKSVPNYTKFLAHFSGGYKSINRIAIP